MKPYGSEDRISCCGCCGGGKSLAGIKSPRVKKLRKPAKARARQRDKRLANER